MDTVGCDSGWRDVGNVFDIGSGGSEFLGENGGGDLVLCPAGVVVSVQWCVWWGGMLLEVKDFTLAGTNRTENVVSRKSMSEGFAMHGILLVCVGEGDVHPGLHVMRETVSGRSLLDVGTTEGDVLQLEGRVPSSLGGGGEGLLTWVAPEKEACALSG